MSLHEMLGVAAENLTICRIVYRDPTTEGSLEFFMADSSAVEPAGITPEECQDAPGIGSNDVTLAAEAGLDAAGAAQALTGQESLDAVAELAYRGRAIGIQGVPFFILLGKYGVSGAQPPEFWREALPKIAAEAEQPAA